MTTKRLLPLIAALSTLVIAIVGCSQGVDEDAWRVEAESHWRYSGANIDDAWWERHKQIMYDTCEDDDFTFGYFAALTWEDQNLTTTRSLRTGVKHACPSRLDELDDHFLDFGGIAGLERVREE